MYGVNAMKQNNDEFNNSYNSLGTDGRLLLLGCYQKTKKVKTMGKDVHDLSTNPDLLTII